ncbi:MAG: leucyl aminopeptidase family protein [Chloroflexi bacterium]|nr:leucyl aminopeptidase family protein [Chloroflexota bacterium]
MQTRVVVGQPWDVEADVLALPIPSDASLPAPVVEIDRRLDGALSAYRTIGELRGKPWSSVMLQGRETASPWILAMGVGEAATFDRLMAVRLGAAIERRLTDRVVTRLAVLLPQALLGTLDVAAAVELVTRGVVEGSAEPGAIYRDGFTSPPVLDVLTIVVEQGDPAVLAAAAERGRIIGEGGNATRRLSQRAANDVSPEVLADEASDLARSHGLQVDILGPEQAEALGMGMFMAVGRGSSNTPRFIVIRNGAAGATDSKGRLLAMVGKGVCFDSGGISIKPADRMEEMKTDKTGACTVISAIATIKQLSPDLPIMAVAPAVENMPGPHSTRPGDVVRAMNGKTVEITNTDAEGRLILGDAFTWAERNGATHLVDVATLTGAVARASGDQIMGGFASPQSWWDEVAAAGALQAERYWQIPFIADYRAEMDSAYADMQNSGSAEGSLIKSGMFLAEFVTKPWAHLDIAGTAFFRKAHPWAARGATGVSHATLVELALGGA